MIDMVSYAEIFELENDIIFTGHGKNKRGFNRFVYPDYNVGYVFGSYLSIGTANISIYMGTKRGLVFWYVRKDLENYIVNLQSALSGSFGLPIKIRQRGSSESPLQVVCYSKPLATLLKRLGQRSGVKRIPPDLFFNESKQFLNGLVDSIEHFEGHKPDNRFLPNRRKLNIEVIMLYNSLKNY
jgi:hypothetical protein